MFSTLKRQFNKKKRVSFLAQNASQKISSRNSPLSVLSKIFFRVIKKTAGVAPIPVAAAPAVNQKRRTRIRTVTADAVGRVYRHHNYYDSTIRRLAYLFRI